jgi:hypothetical protein
MRTSTCQICGKQRVDLARHIARNHPEQDDILDVVASPRGMAELMAVTREPKVAAIMEGLTEEEVRSELSGRTQRGGRHVQGMAATLQEPLVYSPRRVKRKEMEIAAVGGKPKAAALQEILVIPAKRSEEAPRNEMRAIEARITKRTAAAERRRERVPVRIGVQRSTESSRRETRRETVCRRDGSTTSTQEPRYVVRETWVELRHGEVVRRGEITNYEY